MKNKYIGYLDFNIKGYNILVIICQSEKKIMFLKKFENLSRTLFKKFEKRVILNDLNKLTSFKQSNLKYIINIIKTNKINYSTILNVYHKIITSDQFSQVSNTIKNTTNNIMNYERINKIGNIIRIRFPSKGEELLSIDQPCIWPRCQLPFPLPQLPPEMTKLINSKRSSHCQCKEKFRKNMIECKNNKINISTTNNPEVTNIKSDNSHSNEKKNDEEYDKFICF